MGLRNLHPGNFFAAAALIALFGVIPPAHSQSSPQTTPAQDNDTTRAELSRFDQFLDGHPEIAEQLRKDPSLVDNKEFVKNHSALQSYLKDHPGIREELKENPNAFMRREERFDRHEDARDMDVNRAELARFNEFLNGHREIAEQVRKNPSLLNNQAFVENHPALLTYIQEHPAVRQQFKDDPKGFMESENRFARGGEDGRDRDRDRDADAQRSEHERFDRFLDDHHEIAEQIRKNPSLVNDQEYLKNHPELQAYLQQHPGVRDEARDNPSAYLRRDDDFNRSAERQDQDANSDRDADRDRDHDANRDRDMNQGHDMDRDHDFNHDHDMDHDRDHDRDRSASFREFLGGHSEIAEQLSRNPSLAKDRDYVAKHPELRDYLNSHPEVNEQLMKNPQTFVKSAQPTTNNSSDNQGMKAPATGPKSYQ